MERYSVFTEKSTGVNPFVHAPYVPWLPGLVFFTLPRMSLVIPLSTLLFFLEYLTCCVDAVAPSLARLVRKHALSYLARALLFSLGFGVTSIAVRKETLLLRPPPGRPASFPPPSYSGELLLANKSSWLDSLVLLATKGCACGILSDSGVVSRVSLFKAVFLDGGFLGGASSSSPLPPPPFGSGIKSILGATIACHPEGAPTNGKAVLRCGVGLGVLGEAIAAVAPTAPKPTALTVGIHYDTGEGNFTPCFLGTCSPWYHLLCLLSQPSSKVSVLSLPASFDPQPTDFPLIVSPGGNSVQPTSVASAWPLAVGVAWEQLLRGFGVRAVGLDASAHQRYLAMVKGVKKD